MKGRSVHDDLGLFTDQAAEQPVDTSRAHRFRERFGRGRRRRSVSALAGVFVLVVVGGGVAYGGQQLMKVGLYADYQGQGTGEVVIQVTHGDSVSSIARTLAQKDVVASSKAFRNAAEEDAGVNNVQPGYYRMRSHMSGEAAVKLLTSPAAKTGEVEIRGGMRLDDQLAPNGKPTPGILSKLAQAGCTGAPPGQCASPEDMKKAAASADLGQLGVPQWAIGPASKADPQRRLEGLIMPGEYSVRPGEPAQQILKEVVGKSAGQFTRSGLVQAAQASGHSPYEVLTIGSMAQSEAINKDFGKVARVIENRLQKGEALRFDSTINYPLDKPALLTKSEDRNLPGPYNTYMNKGLPPTPISSVSEEALKAAMNPPPGSWLYFVKCAPDGTSCFATTQPEHDQNIKKAQQNGAY